MAERYIWRDEVQWRNPNPKAMNPAPSPGTPLHVHISDRFRREIREGRRLPHEALPSESELCRLFEVSRVTVRRALQTLEGEGLIYRRQGLGSFVADRRVTPGLVRLADFAQELERAGLEARSRVLHRAMEPAPHWVAEALQLPEGSPVFRLDRLRLGNEEPLALDRTWLAPFHAQLLEGHDLGRDTIYGVLERDYGIPILSGRYRITAAAAEDSVARELGVEAGDPVLLIDRTSRSVGGRPVYVQRRFYRSDRMAFELELARDPLSTSEGTAEAGMPLRDFEVVVRRD
jgi:GntR family transcriptional regulator